METPEQSKEGSTAAGFMALCCHLADHRAGSSRWQGKEDRQHRKHLHCKVSKPSLLLEISLATDQSILGTQESPSSTGGNGIILKAMLKGKEFTHPWKTI